MATLGEDQLREMQEALDRTRAKADRIRRRTTALRHSARDKDRLLTVVAGGHGELVDLTFHGDGYRDLAPAELSALILRTAQEARRGAAKQAMAGMRDLLGDLPDPTDLARRATSVDELMDGLAEWVTGATPARGAGG